MGMPFALFLIVYRLTTANPTLAGTKMDDPGRDHTRGIMRVTRQPFLNEVILWAILQLLSNGETRSVVLFAEMLILSAGGIWHIDKRREYYYGADWGPVLLTTSAVPFAAMLNGRTKMDWAGIGWWRRLVSIAVYLALVTVHGFAIGAPAWPVLGQSVFD
jgi:uncharacterized membrane protein